MKVLVIGATGFTGSIAVELLLARGDEVTAFVRKKIEIEDVRNAVGEARDAASLEAAGEVHLFASGLEWVNVWPSRLANGRGEPRGMPVKASLDPKGWPFMTRADLAQFMVLQLTDETWVRKSPLIGY